MQRKARLAISWFCLATCVLAGCNSSLESVTPHHVRGMVEFEGKPIPVGTIYFIPDNAKGNKGPQGIAKIVEGRYDTRSSRFGIVGGDYIVKIEGFDGVQPANDVDGLHTSGKPLFPTYKTHRNFPAADADVDFKVPPSSSNASNGRTGMTS